MDLTGLVVQKDKAYEHILVIGAGDMLIPNYLLNNPLVSKVTVCELDKCVTDSVRKYFSISSNIEKNIESGRLTLIFRDGSKFVEEESAKGSQYDGVVIDNSDVDYINSPAAVLFTPTFFSFVKDILKQGASFSQQTSSPAVNKIWNQRVQEAGFSKLSTFLSFTPEYSTDLPLGKATK